MCMVCMFKALMSRVWQRSERESRLFRSPTGELANSPCEKKKKSISETKQKFQLNSFTIDSNVETELISVNLEISKATNLVSLTEWLQRKLAM